MKYIEIEDNKILKENDERCWADVVGCEWRTLSERCRKFIGITAGEARKIDPNLRLRRPYVHWICQSMSTSPKTRRITLYEYTEYTYDGIRHVWSETSQINAPGIKTMRKCEVEVPI